MSFSGIVTFAHLPHHVCLTNTKLFDVAVLGAPFDTSVSYRPGARFGPYGIRSGSRRDPPGAGYSIQWGSNSLDSGATIVDCGDIPISPYDNALAYDQIETAYSTLLSRPVATEWAEAHGGMKNIAKDGKEHPRIITLGGDHSVVLPILRSLKKVYGPVSVIGYRDLKHDASVGFQLLTTEDIEEMPGTPESGGWTTREVKAILRGLTGLNMVGMDLVEVAPAYDTNTELTTIAAADLIHEFISILMTGKEGPRPALQRNRLVSISRRFHAVCSPVVAGLARADFVADESRARRLARAVTDGRPAPKRLVAVVDDTYTADEAFVALLRACSSVLEHLVIILPAPREQYRPDQIGPRIQPGQIVWECLRKCVALETFEIAGVRIGAPAGVLSGVLASSMIACWPHLRELRVADLDITGPSERNGNSPPRRPHKLRVLYCHITSPSSSTLFSSILIVNPFLNDLKIKIDAQLPLAEDQLFNAIRPHAGSLLILRIQGVHNLITLIPNLKSLHQLQCETSALCGFGESRPDALFAAIRALPRLRQLVLFVTSYFLDIRPHDLIQLLKGARPPMDLVTIRVKRKARTCRDWTTMEHADVAAVAEAVGTKLEIILL
ncbi:hypothetical protein RQP46_006883 [Phenoliferia psychrophenolica]